MLIGANLPDVDVLGLPFGANLAWRRGWTHGPVALVLLPALLAYGLVALDRWQARRGTRPAARAPVRLGGLLGVSYLGALSHLLLDLLNTYGVRLLMPVSERWFYGDTLFIIDPVIWSALALGVWVSRRRARAGGSRVTGTPPTDEAPAITAANAGTGAARPALMALALATVYCVAMYAAGRSAEHYVAGAFRAAGHGEPGQVLASPVLFDPTRRAILVRSAEGYRFGDLRWRPAPQLTFEPAAIDPRMTDPAIARAAAQDRHVADFLYWSRHPFAEVHRTACTTTITLNDARYSRTVEGGPFRVRAELAESAPGCPGTMGNRPGDRR